MEFGEDRVKECSGLSATQVWEVRSEGRLVENRRDSQSEGKRLSNLDARVCMDKIDTEKEREPFPKAMQ